MKLLILDRTHCIIMHTVDDCKNPLCFIKSFVDKMCANGGTERLVHCLSPNKSSSQEMIKVVNPSVLISAIKLCSGISTLIKEGQFNDPIELLDVALEHAQIQYQHLYNIEHADELLEDDKQSTMLNRLAKIKHPLQHALGGSRYLVERFCGACGHKETATIAESDDVSSCIPISCLDKRTRTLSKMLRQNFAASYVRPPPMGSKDTNDTNKCQLCGEFTLYETRWLDDQSFAASENPVLLLQVSPYFVERSSIKSYPAHLNYLTHDRDLKCIQKQVDVAEMLCPELKVDLTSLFHPEGR